MASAAQLTANRANAQHSTGPVTEEGKRHSSRNSTSHGLTSKDVSIPEGLAGEFEALRENLESGLNPETPVQMVFYNQALSAAWRQFLCDQAMANLDQMVSTPGLNPLLDPKLEPTIRTIERVRAQAAKLLAKAITELRKVQTEEQYRWASMPEDQGYQTQGLGVADWQTINKKLQNEAKARREQDFYAPPPPPPESLQDVSPELQTAVAEPPYPPVRKSTNEPNCQLLGGLKPATPSLTPSAKSHTLAESSELLSGSVLLPC